jgi:arylsulfate sulfotransferase
VLASPSFQKIEQVQVCRKPLSFCALLCLTVLVAGCQTWLSIGIGVSPKSAAIAPGQTVHFTATVTNPMTGISSPATANDGPTGVTWSATVGAIDDNGNYTAPSGTQSTSAFVVATSTEDRANGGAIVHIVVPGQVSATANVQVALYSIAPGAPGNVSVQFGLDSNYGLTTWAQPSLGSEPVSLFVAGMKSNSLYHMRAVVQFSDGTEFLDTDHLFTTGDSGPTQAAPITATTTPGMTPQGGVELLDLITGTARPTITDLSGNVLWTYVLGPAGTVPNPIKLLPNGHFLINFSSTTGDGSNSVLQEVDLTGKLIWQMAAADLNKALAAATCAGCNITVIGTHHDFVILPNGHLIVIAATQQDISGTTVTGDVLIDLDTNRNPVWLWNEFDHLDVNRRPYLFPDWTHTNAILYSADDGNLIISIRHQNWLVKVDYANGTGAGDIIWHLGYQGDFTLLGGTDPTDWFYAQHGPSFATANTSGNFSLMVFDNGDDRVFSSGVTCGTGGAPPCLYSTVPLLQIDETAMTATLAFHPTTPTYSFFGGNAAVLANGNVEFCETEGGPGEDGEIYEVTQDRSAQTVWQMHVTGEDAYRGQRISSFYPGVQW